MSLDGFEIIPASTFEQVEEWTMPESPVTPTDPLDYDSFWDFLKAFHESTKAPIEGFFKAIGAWAFMDKPNDPSNAFRELGLGVDISRELRLLGCPEAEIKRWALLKQIERRTGKRCDDYV